MAIFPDSAPEGADTESIAALSDETRRQVVQVLHERKSEISLRSLADLLAGPYSAKAGTEDAESIQIRLYHNHLPKLAAAGLVELDEMGRTVSTTDHPVYERERVEEMTGGDGSDRRTLTCERHRQILEIVEAECGVISREMLARKMARWKADNQATSSLVETLEIRLHHQDLPKLVEAELVEYNQDDGIVEDRERVEATPAAPESTSS